MLEHVFFDESNHTARDGFMAIAGVNCDDADYADLRQLVTDWRSPKRRQREFHWNSLSHKNLRLYSEFVDFVFDLHEKNLVHFHVLTLPNESKQDPEYLNVSPQTTLYKLHYQLCLHRFAPLYLRDSRDHMIVTVDQQGESNYDYDEFELILNNGIRKKLPHLVRPVHRVRLGDSAKSTMIQMADIIAGGVMHQRNQRHLGKQAGKPRSNLSERIRERSGLDNFTDATPLQGSFTIWPFEFGKGRPRRT